MHAMSVIGSVCLPRAAPVDVAMYPGTSLQSVISQARKGLCYTVFSGSREDICSVSASGFSDLGWSRCHWTLVHCRVVLGLGTFLALLVSIWVCKGDYEKLIIIERHYFTFA